MDSAEAWQRVLELDRLIHAIANRALRKDDAAIRGLGMDFDDVLQLARLLSLRLVQQHDPSHGVPLGAWVTQMLPLKLIEQLYPQRVSKTKRRQAVPRAISLEQLREATGYDVVAEQDVAAVATGRASADEWFPQLWAELANNERAVLYEIVMHGVGARRALAARWGVSESRVSQIASTLKARILVAVA